MGRNQQSKGGGYAGNKGNKTYASGGKGGGNKKTVDAATALGLGLPPQNTMLSGMAGLGMVQQTPLDSLFGSMGTDAMTGLGGLGGASLQSANSGNDLVQLLGGTSRGLTAEKCDFSACSAPASTTGASTATSNAGRGTSSGDKDTNRGRSHYTSGGACKH